MISCSNEADIDSAILTIVGDIAFENSESGGIVKGSEVIGKAKEKHGLSDEEIEESLDVLRDRGHIEFSKVSGGMPHYSILLDCRGFWWYCENRVEGFDIIQEKVAGALLKGDVAHDEAIATSVGYDPFLIRSLLECYARLDYVEVSKTSAGIYVHTVTGSGRRKFRDLLGDE